MKSAYENIRCTTMTTKFMGCIDYIFYETERLFLEKIVPLPTVKELQKNDAIPSEVYPSDHLALIADLKWELKKNELIFFFSLFQKNFNRKYIEKTKKIKQKSFLLFSFL